MPETKSWYMTFAVGVFVGNLLIDLALEQHLTVKLVLKAALAALLTLGLITWWNRRKSSRANASR
jgi:hypothetical protein